MILDLGGWNMAVVDVLRGDLMKAYTNVSLQSKSSTENSCHYCKKVIQKQMQHVPCVKSKIIAKNPQIQNYYAIPDNPLFDCKLT